MSRLVMAVALVAASAAPLPAQEVLWKFFAQPYEGDFGASTANDVDVNGDGFADVIVGVPGRSAAGFTCGAVLVFSGKDGARIHDVTWNPTVNAFFGSCVTGLKDLDGDGCDEFVGSSDLSGVVVVFSGRTGAPLLTINSSASSFGRILDDAGDHDGDGLHDLIIGRYGGVAIHSSAGGALIVDLVPNGTRINYAVSAANAGDVDADGFDDVIVGDSRGGPFNPATCKCNNSGKVYVFSGKDGSQLYEIQGSSNSYPNSTTCTTWTSGWGGSSRFCFTNFHEPAFGISVDGAGDVDGDGHADFVIGRPGYTLIPVGNADVGHAYVYSGATGTLLFDLTDPVLGLNSDLGDLVEGCGDVNGDGVADALARDPEAGGYVFSGLNGARLYGHESNTSRYSRGGGDVNGDGRADLVFSNVVAVPDEVDVIAGSELFVDASWHQLPHTYALPITISSAQGGAGALVLVALTEVGSVPTFLPIALGTLDALGAYQSVFTDPGTLPPDSYGIQAFTLGAGGKLLASPVEWIVLY
jgi:hypothetical protein